MKSEKKRLEVKLLPSKLKLTGDNFKRCFPFTTESSLNPLPENKILDWSKVKQIADDIIKCI